jgi:IBR domain, a half RING-finger domain/RING-type zinc-finger
VLEIALEGNIAGLFMNPRSVMIYSDTTFLNEKLSQASVVENVHTEIAGNRTSPQSGQETARAASRKRAQMVAEQELRKAEQDARKAEVQRIGQEARKAEHEARRAEIIKKDAALTIREIVLGSTLVTCGAGIDIQHVISGFETCRLTIKGLPLDAKAEEVVALFSQQGLDSQDVLVLGMNGIDGRHREARVLTKAEQGRAIAVGLDGVEFRAERLRFEVTENTPANAMGESISRNSDVLTISWPAPSVCMIATYLTMDEARTKVRILDKTILKDRRVKVVMNQPPPPGRALQHYSPSSIRINGLPPGVTSAEVTQFAGSLSVRQIKSSLYNLPDAIETLRQNLRNLPDGGMRSFEVTSRPDSIVVQARFDSWELAKAARDTLDGKRLQPDFPFFRCSLPDPLHFISTIPLQQYHAQQRQWDALAAPREDRSAQLRIHVPDNKRAIIRVTGDDQKIVGSLKVRVETLVAGERLDATCWHRSFNSPQGQKFLAKIHSDTGVYVRVDRRILAIKMHGDSDTKEGARQMIMDEVDRLALLEWTVFLKRVSVGFFVRKGLAALKEILGEDSVTLDLSSRPYKLTIKGGEEARHTLNRLMDQSLEELDFDQPLRTEAGHVCPICYDEVSHPVLLGCGHMYCTACIRHYLTAAADTKSFPLACMGDEDKCRVTIPIPIIQKFLVPQQFNQLINVAFTTYLDHHPQNFRYCPTPDCDQIYRCNVDTALKCPSCFVTVCSACHEEAHDGMTCAERKLHNDPAEQDRLNETWASARGVKKCPSCQVWIEKTEGCNHMTCNCGAHICWKCMGVFPKDDIYQHLREMHGGIFEHDEVEDPDDGRPIPVLQAQQQADQLRALRYAELFAQREAERRLQQQRELREEALVRQEAERRRRRAEILAEEARRREEYQRQLDIRQEQLRREAERRRQERGRFCVIM